jgi:hypothetical protein
MPANRHGNPSNLMSGPRGKRRQRRARPRARLDFDVTPEMKIAWELEAARLGVSRSTLFRLAWNYWRGIPLRPPPPPATSPSAT